MAEEIKEITTYTSKFYDYDTKRMYEQIATGQFLYLKDDKKTIVIVPEIRSKLKNGTIFIIKPLDNKTTKLKAIPLPYTATEYHSTEILIKKIYNHIHKHLDVTNRFRKIASWYVIMTWVKDKLYTVGYLRALGTWGHGKSRYFDVVGNLCYKPIPFAGALTPAPLYRLMDLWSGTLLLDECVLPNSDTSNFVVQILNSGIQRGKYVWRCDKENNNDVDPFDPFGPKIIASREPFKDNALESRCIDEYMKETKRDDITVELTPDFYKEQIDLRNQLLMFRLRNWNTINAGNIKNIDFPQNTTKRLQQMIAPFAITFFKFPKIIKDLTSFAEGFYHEQVKNNSQTLQGGIVNAIWKLYLSGKEQITSADIKVEMKSLGVEVESITDIKIGRERSNLNIKAEQKTVRAKSKKSIVWNDELMTTLMKRYVAEDEQKEFTDKLKRMRERVKSNPIKEDKGDDPSVDWQV